MIRPILWIFAFTFLLLFLVLPLGMLFQDVIWQDGRLTVTSLVSTVSAPELRGLLLNSLRLALLVTVFSTLLAIPVSAALGRWDFPGRTLLIFVFLTPLVVPPFIGAIGLKKILGATGPLSAMLIQSSFQETFNVIAAHGFAGLILVETIHFSPLIFLMLLTPMALTRGKVEEAASGLGGKRYLKVKRIFFPMIRPSLVAGMLMVFLLSLAELGAPLIFGYKALVPVTIFESTTETGVSSTGLALAVILLAIVLLMFVLSRRLMRRQLTWHSICHTASPPSPLRGWLLVRKLLWIVPLAFLTVLPQVGVLLNALSKEWSMTVLPQSYTLSHITDCFRIPLSSAGIGNSLHLGIFAALIGTVAAFAIAWLLVKQPIRKNSILDFFASLPLAIPGVLVAVGYLNLFRGTAYSPVAAAAPVLVMAYAVRRLPYMVRCIGTEVSGISPTLQEAAYSLGASGFRVWRKVTIPLLLPGIIAGAVVAFTFCFVEIGCSLILVFRNEDYPLAKSIWSMFAEGGNDLATASVLGLVGILFALIGLAVASRTLGRRIVDLFTPSW